MNNKHKISKQMSRKEKEIEQRKKDILIVAEKLFLSQGYDDTTMDQIAQVAEFSKGTVYKYFSSKDEIYLTLGIKSYQMIIDKTKKLTENEEPGVSQLIAVGRAYFEFYKEAPEYAMIFHHIGDKLPLILNKSKEELTPNEIAYLALSDAYRDLFVEIISQAIKYKKIRIDKDPIMIGITLATLTSGLIKELTRRENNLEKLQLTSDQIVDFVFEMLGEGLKPRE
jgi:TetR/AcrR family transcriptional regulator